MSKHHATSAQTALKCAKIENSKTLDWGEIQETLHPKKLISITKLSMIVLVGEHDKINMYLHGDWCILQVVLQSSLPKENVLPSGGLSKGSLHQIVASKRQKSVATLPCLWSNMVNACWAKNSPTRIWQREKSWFQQSLGWSFCSFPCKQVILNPPLSRTRLCHSLNTQANTPNQHSTTPITAFVPLTCSVFELNGKWTIQKSVLEVESSKWNQDGFLAFASVDV